MLQGAGIEAPRREARLLLGYLLGVRARSLPPANAAVDEAALQHAVERRLAREPLAFITGAQGFWSLDFEVSPATLIPRADTEALVEAALAEFREREGVRSVLDLGTGTGCLLLAALSEFPSAFGVGVDLVPAAAALAARNAARAGFEGRATFLVADWAAPLMGQFDLILCNPPYIESGDFAALMPEVAAYEPKLALDGGVDGLAAYRHLIPVVRGLLAPAGAAIFELGLGQGAAVADLAKAAGFTYIGTRQDLGGVDRALVLRPSD